MAITVDEKYIQKLLRTINHDMSAALRSSVGFSTLIHAEYKDTLDDKAIGWLELNIEQGKITQAALIALSEYAHLYDVQEEMARCDLNALAAAACDTLREYEHFDTVNIDIQLSSSISGYKLLWRDYFKQVIGNSVQHSGATQCIVSEKHEGNAFKIVIEDNGNRLNEKQMANILLPFRSLDNKNTVGLGLSRAKRIAELHGGNLKLYLNQQGFCVEASLPADITDSATLLN